MTGLKIVCVCVCHNDHQLFVIDYHLKIFRSQVATGKKKLILRPANSFSNANILRNITTPILANHTILVSSPPAVYNKA